MALAEPYRTTILLRWFEDLGPAEIAARENTPVETIRTRLKRAHAQLAKSLDAEYGGDGRRWIAALLPLAGVTAAGSALSTKATVLGAAAAVLILAASVSVMWPGESSAPSVAPTSIVADATPLPPPPPAPEPPPARADTTPPVVPDPPFLPPAPPPPALIVRVMATSGEAIEGATVRLLRWTPRRPEMWKGYDQARLVLTRHARGREEIAKAKADEDGQARLEDLSPGSYVVRGDAGGFAGRESRVTIADGVEAPPVLLLLSPGARLSGTVRRRDGRPCPGVTVNAGPEHETVTDAQGGYGLTDLAPGPIGLTVCPSPGTSFDAGKVDVPRVSRFDIVLDFSGVVVGRITDRETGRPVAGAEVSVAAGAVRWGAWARALSGSDGTYRVEGIPAESLGNIQVWAEGYVLWSSTYPRAQPMLSGQPFVQDAGLTRGATLRGRVALASGEPVVGAEVCLYSRDWRTLHLDRAFRTTTRDDGSYVISGLPLGRASVAVRAEGCYQPGFDWSTEIWRHEEFSAGIVVPEFGEVVKDVTLVRGGVVSGVVRDPDGNPIPDAAVTIRGGGSARAISGPDGRFALTGLRPGTYQVRAGSVLDARREDPEYAPEDGRLVEAGTEGLRIKLARAFVIAGRVTDPDGRPVPFVDIDVNGCVGPRKPDPGHYHRPETDLHGRFRISRLPAGRDDLRFSEPTSRGRVREGFIVMRMKGVRAGTEGIEVVMRRGLSISGRVVGFNGQPVSGEGELRVAPTGAKITGSSNPWAPVRLAADGSFATRPLDPETTWDLRTGGFPGADTGYVRRLTAGTEGVIVRLVRGLTISGRVLDEAGNSAAGVRVAAYPERNSRNLMPKHATSGDDGRFVIEGLAENAYRILGGGVGQDWEKVGSATVSAGAHGVVIRVRRLCRITGRVVDETGEPIRCGVGWRQEFPGGGSRSAGRSTDNEGRFVLRGLRPGTVTLTLGLGSRRVEVGEFEAPADGLVLTVP